MNRESIVEALKSGCGNRNFKFQVVIHHERLHIYVNHRDNYQPDYFLLQETVANAIANLALSIDAVWLYTRPLGKLEPEWQTIVELPAPVQDNEEVDTIGTTQNQQEKQVSSIEAQNQQSDYPKGTLRDRLDDTRLLQDTGFIHGSPLGEEEIDITSSSSEPQVQNANGNSAQDLTRYCFVANQKLLTGDIIAPEKEIMRLIKFFHHLSFRAQHELLPILEVYLQRGETPNSDNLAIAVQKWLRQIDELNDEDRQMFAIWLSRYCFNSSATLEEFKTITARNNEKATAAKVKYRSTEYSFTPSNGNLSNSASEEFNELEERKFQLPPAVRKLILPSIWVLATVILLTLGIATNNPGNVAADRLTPICNDTTASTDYCRLAVNLAGERTIAKSSSSLFPLTEVTETVASYGCQRYTNLKAGYSAIAPEKTPVLSSYGEKILPQIYVVQVEQKSLKQSENIRVGCVYTAGRGQRSPELLAADLIPLDWPQEPYYKQSLKGISFGGFTNPINLGLYTIFAALGIAIASWLNLGIKIERVQTIYLVALLLGVVQSIAASIAALGLIATIALLVLTIFMANLLIPGFKINWNYGYSMVAASVFLIVAIQFLLYGLCLELIGSLV